MTYEQFLVQAFGLIAALKSKGVIVIYNADSRVTMGKQSSSLFANTDMDDGPFFDIRINDEDTVESYESALATLRRALEMSEAKEATLARLKDLTSALSATELGVLRGPTMQAFIQSVLAQKTAPPAPAPSVEQAP